MTRWERVLRAIYHQPVDKLPKGEWALAPKLVYKLLNRTWAEGFQAEMAVRKFLGMDLVVLQCNGGMQETLTSLRRWRKETDFFIFALLEGPFQRSARGQDFMDYLLQLGQGNEKMIKLATQQAHDGVVQAKELLSQGAHGILLADDVAYSDGLYLPIGLMRDIFVPLWRAQVEALKGQSVPVFFHSDGNIAGLLPDLVNAGFNGIHGLDPSAGMDIVQIKKEYGADLCLMGNVDVGFLNTAQEVQLEISVKRMLDVVAKGSGYIFSTSSGCLGEDLSAEKVRLLYHCVERYR